MNQDDYDIVLEAVRDAYDTLADNEDLNTDLENPMKWRCGHPDTRRSWSEGGRRYNINATAVSVLDAPAIYIEANAWEDDLEKDERQWTHRPIGLYELQWGGDELSEQSYDDIKDAVQEAYDEIAGVALEEQDKLNLTDEEKDMIDGR